MKKIKAFLYIFEKSISSVKYYQEIIKSSTAFSLKYFVVLAILASFITTAGVLIPNLSKIDNRIKNFLEQVKNVYPADLTITVKEGKLSINQPEPYFIMFPKYMPESVQNVPSNLVVFDSNGTIDDVTKYNTLILVNQTNVLMRNENKVEASPISNIPDGTLTKANVDQFFGTIESYVKYVPFVLAIFIFVGMLFYYGLYRIIYLLLVGVILWVIGKVRKMEFGYDKYFRIAIHTFTLPLVIDMIVKIVNVIPVFPLWFFIINIIFGVVVIASLQKAPKEAN